MEEKRRDQFYSRLDSLARKFRNIREKVGGKFISVKVYCLLRKKKKKEKRKQEKELQHVENEIRES